MTVSVSRPEVDSPPTSPTSVRANEVGLVSGERGRIGEWGTR